MVHTQHIYLNIYDLTRFNDFLHFLGLGFYHSGIEVNGIEYIYVEGAGIIKVQPKNIKFGTFRKSVKLGELKMSSYDIQYEIYNLLLNYKNNDYDIILKNCNSFSDSICLKLFNKHIPSFVNRWANFVRPLYACTLGNKKYKDKK